MRIAVSTVAESVCVCSAPSTTCFSRFTEPRLHTAVSSRDVLSVISVHRLELCTTPTWSCGERMFDGSLNVIQGWPVSNSIDSILRHSFTAETVLVSASRPARALRSYSR